MAAIYLNWIEVVDGALTDLLRFASYRSLGYDVATVAHVMHITVGLAERYEAAITRLMADLQNGTAPDAPEAVPDPPKEIQPK